LPFTKSLLLTAYLQTELQHQLEVRGLDKDGNEEELANRLLDTLIAQVSTASSGGLASIFVLLVTALKFRGTTWCAF
jgi:hypothetical protein